MDILNFQYILMRKVVFILLFVLTVVVSYGQDSPEILRLKAKLEGNPVDTVAINICNNLAKEYSKSNFDSVKKYTLKCLAYSQNKPITHRSYYFANHTVGIYYLISGTYPDSAIYYFNNAIVSARARKKDGEEAASLSNLAYVYVNLNLYEKALKINFELLKLREAAKDSIDLGNNYNTISIVLSKMHRFDEAIVYSNKAIEIDSLIKKEEGLLASYINISAAYSGLHNHVMAISYLNRAKELCVKLNDKASISTVTLNLAVVYSDMGEYDRAAGMISGLIKDGITQMQDPVANNTLFYNLGEIYSKQNKLDSAIYAYSTAVQYAESAGFLAGISNSKYGLAETYSKKGDYAKAYNYLYESYAIRDSVFNEDKNRTLSELKIGYEVDKKESENKQLVEESVLKDTQIQQQLIIILTLGILLLVIILGGTYLYRQRKVIAEQKEKILEQKLLQMQLNPHFIFNSLQAIQEYIYSNNEQQASKYLSKFARLMRLTLENSRQENILLKTEIELLDNYLALQKLRIGDKLEYHITIAEDIDPSFTEIPPMLVQPFVENAVEHGVKMKEGNGVVMVSFSLTGNMLNIIVSDDGPGITTSAQAKDHHSLSVQIIKERLALLGKKKKIKPQLKISDLGTTQNKGTRVEINLPTEV